MKKTCSLNRKSLLRTGLAACVLVAAAASGGPAVAATIAFDFSAGTGTNELLGTNVVVNGVKAEGFETDLNTQAKLFRRNQTNDHGLGVCSGREETESKCAIGGSGGGDWNELSNEFVPEFIRLTRPDFYTWSSLWVSSLDSGGSGDSEEGRLFWSNTATGFSAANSVLFMFGDAGSSVEFDLFGEITIPDALRSAKYLLFAHPGAFDTDSSGDNNDYLVWKGVVTGPDDVPGVPEPGTLFLLGLGLAGLAATRRRKQ